MSIGPFQLLLIVLLVLILFGAGKLPKVMGDVGKGIRNMKKGLSGEDEEEKEKKVALLEQKASHGELTDEERKTLDKLKKG